MEEVVEVPCYFLCPISMQMMKDPVIVATGITYDRDFIEKWIFSCNNTTCPVTNQDLKSTDLTPNHTLRRLIQSWCTLHESDGFHRIPTPKPQPDKSQILKLINQANMIMSSSSSSNGTTKQELVKCLEMLRSIAHGCRTNKRNLVAAAGAVDFLVMAMKRNNSDEGTQQVAELALDILCHIELSDREMMNLMRDNDGAFLDSLMRILKYGNCQSRGFAVMLFKSLYNVADPKHLIGVTTEFFAEVVKVMRDSNNHDYGFDDESSSPSASSATKAALKLLVELCPWGRNRIKAVEGGAVTALIELLLETNHRDDQKRGCELMLMVLDQLCQCAEGRAELLKHGAGLAVVSKKILRVSHVASDRAVRILGSISKSSANSRVLQEMLQVGVVAKLCLVLQVESGQKTKERAKEILKLHSRVWKASPCIPPHLLSSYPSTN